MNYDKIIVEMLSRIQELEEKVEILSTNQNNKPDVPKVTTPEIKAFIENRIGEAFANGENEITIKAIDIHKAMGLKSRYPMVCNAMRQCMKDGDVVVFEPESGYSSTLEIRYFREVQDE